MTEKNGFEENITWYYGMKIFIVAITCASYIIYNFDNVQAINFATTTVLYFLPFSLDFLIRSTDTNKQKYQKKIGIIIPFTITFIFIVYTIAGSSFNWLLAIKINILIKIIFSFLSLIFVKFALDDFNTYTKNREKVIEQRKLMRFRIDSKFGENMQNRISQAQAQKAKGLKKVASQSNKSKKNKGSNKRKKGKK
ncbi:hypothetical protein HMPREF2639_03180 [Staphylococcus sp. HMSC078D05]|nr:hypothetical protein HMPREF2639_03180 [Staphylococcus sp. HMSC078D05]